MQVSELKTIIATYLGLSSSAALIINGEDLGLAGLNSARRKAEQAHDFKYSELNCFLSVPSASVGGALTSAYVTSTITVTGTLSPNATGTYTLAGTHNGYPLYSMLAGGTTYFLSFQGTAWQIIAGTLVGATDYWVFSSSNSNPTGSYTAHGSNTGIATVTASNGAIGIKKLNYVSLPLTNGEYQPVEFLSNDQYLSRVTKQIGRQAFNAGKSLLQLGVSFLGNPLAYQNGQSIFLAPSTLPFPVITQLNVIRWMPNYTADTDTDYFTTYGPEYLQWQGILEVNKLKKFFTVRQEGDIDENNVKELANIAYQSLVQWDSGVESGANEVGQPQPPVPIAAQGGQQNG